MSTPGLRAAAGPWLLRQQGQAARPRRQAVGMSLLHAVLVKKRWGRAEGVTAEAAVGFAVLEKGVTGDVGELAGTKGQDCLRLSDHVRLSVQHLGGAGLSPERCLCFPLSPSPVPPRRLESMLGKREFGLI